MRAVLARLLAVLAVAYRRQPRRVKALLAAVVVWVCARAGVIVDPVSVMDAVGLVLPIVLGGEVAHRKSGKGQA